MNWTHNHRPSCFSTKRRIFISWDTRAVMYQLWCPVNSLHSINRPITQHTPPSANTEKLCVFTVPGCQLTWKVWLCNFLSVQPITWWINPCFMPISSNVALRWHKVTSFSTELTSALTGSRLYPTYESAWIINETFKDLLSETEVF